MLSSVLVDDAASLRRHCPTLARWSLISSGCLWKRGMAPQRFLRRWVCRASPL